MEPGDLESRVSSLEHQVRDLTGRVRATEQDAAAARVLAGAADRDVGEIRGELRDFRKATSVSFNALRQDFVDVRTHVDERFARVHEQFAHINEKFAHVDEQFAHVDEQFSHINEQFSRVDGGFAEMRAKLDGAAAGQQQIVDLIQRALDEPAD